MWLVPMNATASTALLDATVRLISMNVIQQFVLQIQTVLMMLEVITVFAKMASQVII